MKVMMTAAAFAAVMILAGCQMPGKLVGEATAPDCPKCKSVTTTGVFRGTTVTTVVCPGCKVEYDDPRLLDYRQPEAGILCCEGCKVNYRMCRGCGGSR